jgi:glycosyltransferase involved in cell wall biosynthesis
MARVSVIIPTYNCEREIGEALRSVHAQTYSDWEVVVGDDASTDRTVEIAADFGDRVTVIRSDRNRGPAGARNVAVDAARGELLAFLDADDHWLPEYLSEQVALFDRSVAPGARVGIVASDALLLGPDGFSASSWHDALPFPEPLTLAKLLVANPIFLGGAMVPRAAIEHAGTFSADCFGTEDYDLWVRLLELGYRAVPNPTALAVYRLRRESVSADAARAARNKQTLYRRALERGRLGRRERRIARRELRVQRLVEEIAEIREQRRHLGHAPYGRLIRAAPRLVAVATENPQRWVRVARRLPPGRGPLVRERDAVLR